MKGKVTGGRVIGVKDLKMGEGTSYAEKIEGNKRNFGRKVVSFLFFLLEVCNITLRCINIDISSVLGCTIALLAEGIPCLSHSLLVHHAHPSRYVPPRVNFMDETFLLFCHIVLHGRKKYISHMSNS